MGSPFGEDRANNAHLSKVLDMMFPSDYIELYHTPPNSVCSLLATKKLNVLTDRGYFRDNQANSTQKLVVSTEPTSRLNTVNLRDKLNSSLSYHRAKPVGLCPVRRAIYDQCFDELIRQVTIGCIEQGLLLFRIRNELRMTNNYYKRAYESGVEFGLSKAIGAEIELADFRLKIRQSESSEDKIGDSSQPNGDGGYVNSIELRNKLESTDRKLEYLKSQLAKKDLIMDQQRSIIRDLSQRISGDLKGPL